MKRGYKVVVFCEDDNTLRSACIPFSAPCSVIYKPGEFVQPHAGMGCLCVFETLNEVIRSPLLGALWECKYMKAHRQVLCDGKVSKPVTIGVGASKVKLIRELAHETGI